MQNNFIASLEEELKKELPGLKAQLEMAHILRNEKLVNVKRPEGHKTACVLSLLYPHKGAWHIVLILRNDYKGVHSNQVGFPGGTWEETDADLLDTALRETFEEIGVDRKHIQVLGRLTELYIPVSNFLVHPFVGYAKERPEFVRDPGEVQEILEFPIEYFLDEENVKTKEMKIGSSLLLKDVPYYDIGNKTIWGATAMMLSEFVSVLKNTNLN